MASKKTITEVVTVLCEGFGRSPSAATFLAYEFGLEGIADDQVKQAARAALQHARATFADVLILETCQDILEMKAQILASREAMAATGRKVPIQCSITLDPTGRMLLGTDYRGALATLEAMHVDIIGLNSAMALGCGRCPGSVVAHSPCVKQLRTNSSDACVEPSAFRFW